MAHHNATNICTCHDSTTVVTCAKFIPINSIQLGWEQNEISIEFELRKIIHEMGPWTTDMRCMTFRNTGHASCYYLPFPTQSITVNETFITVHALKQKPDIWQIWISIKSFKLKTLVTTAWVVEIVWHLCRHITDSDSDRLSDSDKFIQQKYIQVPYQVYMSFLEIQRTL